jgi:divalent metal cation (Fe/Co/Zn/Cd) transporter
MADLYLADLHIEVEATLTVEANIMEELPQVAHIIVHVDPWEADS